MSEDDREHLVIAYLPRSKESKALQRHLLTVDTTTVTKAVLAILAYLAINSSAQPICKAVGKGMESSQLTELAAALTAQLEMLTAQSKVMARMMVRLEALEQTFKIPSATRS